MTNQLEALRADFVGKVEQLEEVNAILKTEFVGIDNVIDDLTDKVRSWYTMTSIQDRPAVINLWGLTGVGKTSLVLRLMELLNFQDQTYRLDLGEKDGRSSLRTVLEDLCDNKDDSPIVIILDEFQHARTIKGAGPMREEVDNDQNRLVWELIDSGTIVDHQWKYGLWTFERLIQKLEQLVHNGVKAEKGYITSGRELYMKEFRLEVEDDEPILFFPDDNYGSVVGLSENDNVLWTHVQHAFMEMNETETLEYMKKIFKGAKRPSKKSFSKALIFVIGNMDEAYTMSGNFTSEISADEFYELSLKITVPDIKTALQFRFRGEQIARLGNNHIIYPALSKKAYENIIQLQLEKLNQKLQQELGIEMSFDASVIDIIFKEGVYPTQGVRPVLTTIESIIKSRISIYLNRILKHQLNTDHLHLFMKEEAQLACGFYEKEVLKFTYSDTVQLHLEDLRKPKMDELQAIAAVHESGHAVLSAVLLNNIPELVVTNTADNNAVGFVYSKDDKDYIAKKDIILKAAVHFGGLIAEELIFGKDNITAGAAGDIANATALIMRMLKSNGMGSQAINFALSSVEERLSLHNVTDIEGEAALLLDQAKELAMNTLKKERKLLLVLSEILSTRSRMEKEELKEIILVHVSSPILTDKSTFYRDKLKAQFNTINVLSEINSVNPIQLNKNKE